MLISIQLYINLNALYNGHFPTTISRDLSTDRI